MTMAESDEQYFVYENRLASFRGPQPVSKGRVSTASSRAPKALNWPHKAPSPVALAKAGFFFEPHPKSPDNVVCFLCGKSLDGWEEDDDPVEEHLKHSPTCGWAIMTAIEVGWGNYGKVHPLDPAMIEARKATFAGRWPYESKRSFKCKTKKLVEGGWKYTPSLDADDMTTCSYCHLALEGWDPEDNPFDEHYRREPGCPFFALINQHPVPKKPGRAKAARSSKASRLSVQSVATVATAASDLVSAADITVDHDDSVLTTASTMTQGGKKSTRGKRTTAVKGRKTRAKKEEAVEILEDEPQVQDLPKHAPARGRKRASDAMEETAATHIEEPAPKRRATRGKLSNAADTSAVGDAEMMDAAPAKKPATRKKPRGSAAKVSRKASLASIASQASTASLRTDVPDDEELERRLEADLERYEEDAEEVVQKPPPPARGRPKKASTARKPSSHRQMAKQDTYAMLDPTPAVPDEGDIEAELDALQDEMEVDEVATTNALVVPKKGRKAGTRKVSKQTKKAKAAEPESGPAAAADEEPLAAPDRMSVGIPDLSEQVTELEPEAGPLPEYADDLDTDTGTVVTKPVGRPSLEKRRRGRPSKKSTSSQATVEEPNKRGSLSTVAQAMAQPGAPDNSQEPLSARVSRKPAPTALHCAGPTHLPAPAPVPSSDPISAAQTSTRSGKHPAAPPSSTSRLALGPPSTPRTTRTAPSGRNATEATVISSSRARRSSSRAEERLPAPALQPAASVIPKRVALAPVSQQMTPLRGLGGSFSSSSPSKRNIVAGLQSTTPWQPADLDLLFLSSSPAQSLDRGGDADKENAGGGLPAGDGEAKGAVARLLRKGAELSTPEKRMTVEEWIYHNAGLAEQKLKRECEAMVAAFEREGYRALRVLEGLVVE